MNPNIKIMKNKENGDIQVWIREGTICPQCGRKLSSAKTITYMGKGVFYCFLCGDLALGKEMKPNDDERPRRNIERDKSSTIGHS
jgi:ribosomal protein L37AE/L43A